MDPENFVVTIELVPGRESFGASTDTLVDIAKDASFPQSFLRPLLYQSDLYGNTHTLA